MWPMVDNYEIHGVLGHGGMGVVYRAYDRKRGTMVALKTVIGAIPTTLYRFKQEFRTLLDLSHPNLVNLYELISDGQNWFITMELIDGVNFLEYVRSGFAHPHEDLIADAGPDVHPSPVPGERHPAGSGGLDIPSAPALDPRPAAATVVQRERLREVLRQLARGLMALHDAGKLHRDIKPTNVLVTGEGRVVLLDFGLATELEPAGPAPERRRAGRRHGRLHGARSRRRACRSRRRATGTASGHALPGADRPAPFPRQAARGAGRTSSVRPAGPAELVADVPDDLDALCVELLRREPEARPTGREVLAAPRRRPDGVAGPTSARSPRSGCSR